MGKQVHKATILGKLEGEGVFHGTHLGTYFTVEPHDDLWKAVISTKTIIKADKTDAALAAISYIENRN